MKRSAETGGDMRRRAGVVRASEKECRNRRRHEEKSRSSKGSEKECRNRRRHEEKSRSSKGE